MWNRPWSGPVLKYNAANSDREVHSTSHTLSLPDAYLQVLRGDLVSSEDGMVAGANLVQKAYNAFHEKVRWVERP